MPCSASISPAATYCYLIEGKLTIFLPTVRRRQVSSNNVYEQASQALQSGMGSGALAKSNQYIVRLSYLNDGTNSTTALPPLSGTNATTIAVDGSGSNNGTSPVTWAMLGVFGGVFALAVLAFAYYKRRQKRREEEPKARVVNEIPDDNETIVSSSTTRIVSLFPPSRNGRGGVVLSDAASVDDNNRRKDGSLW